MMLITNNLSCYDHDVHDYQQLKLLRPRCALLGVGKEARAFIPNSSADFRAIGLEPKTQTPSPDTDHRPFPPPEEAAKMGKRLHSRHHRIILTPETA
jgi:hypothetical protein